MGGIALLLWGMHMIQSGIVRAYGADLRRFLGKALRNRFSAFGVGTLVPAEQAPGVRTMLGLITGEPALNILLGALLAWAAHSSVAVVLLVMSLSYSHFVAPVAALALVLGANLGSAINPVLEGGGLANPAARRPPVGNPIQRLV